jgi:hypothetical protein
MMMMVMMGRGVKEYWAGVPPPPPHVHMRCM